MIEKEKKYSNLTKLILRRIFKVDLDYIATSLEKTASELNVSKNNVVILEKEKKEVEKKASNLSNNLKKNKENIDLAKKENEKLKLKNNELIGNYSKLEMIKTQLQKEVSELKDNISKKDEIISLNEITISSLENEKDEIKNEITKLKAYVTRLKNKLEKKEELETIKLTNAEVDSLIEKNINAEKKNNVLQNNNNSFKKIVDSLENQLKAVNCEFSKTKEELSTAYSLIENKNKELKDLYKIKKYCEEIITENEKFKDIIFSLKNSKKDQDEDISYSKELNVLARELEEKDKEIQRLTEDKAKHTNSIKELLDDIEEFKKHYNYDITQLNNLLQEKISYIFNLENKIKQLEEQLTERKNSKYNDVFSQDNKENVIVAEKISEEATDNDNVTTSSNKISAKRNIVVDKATGNSFDNVENIAIDLPNIENNADVETVRTIEKVFNTQTGEIILANDFFKQSQESIAFISRQLEIISRFNIDPLFVCAKCMQPIKISKISKKKGESQFFTHCKHDVKCAWKISNDIKPLADVIINDSDFDCISKEYSRYNHLKQLIIKTLNKQKNTGDDIEIINDTKITACNNKRSWRKYDIVIRWHGKNIVFKLQRSKDFLQDLVSHDKFAKENNYYIIWIFGSDSATRYDYLLELNYQNTMFDNKSCVFILDKESEIECEKTGVLHLKCNWLVDGKQWYYTIKKSGTNGKLITLDDLIFDDNNYKPYYKEGFEPNLEDDRKKLKSDIYAYRIGSLWGLINSNQNIRTKCKYSLIELDNDGRIRATTADYPHQKVGYISDEGEEIPTCKENLNNNIFMICVFEQWYLALDTGQRLSENFDQIIKWNENRVVFKQNNKFGILDYQGEIISEAKYKSFMIESEEKAIVSDSSGTYYIDINGNIIAEETVILKDDFKKVKHLGKWGLMKDGKLIIDYIYDEIGSFRCRLYGFCDKKIIKLANDPRYNYRISFKAKYITYSSVFYVFEINGVKLFMPDNEYNHQTRVKGEYYDVQLLNIDRSIERISIMALNNKNINSKFEHIDQDSDFPKNKHFTGIITFIKSYNGRRYVKFENGQETYISKNRIARCGFNPNNYVVNSKITLEKTGFDDFYERTIWKVIR